MATRSSSVVIDVHGNIFPCYVFPYTNHKLESQNLIGHVKDGTIFSKNPIQFRNWFNDMISNQFPCPDCPLFPVCGGACPLKWYEGEFGCPSFKYNIEERIILDYLASKDDYFTKLFKE